jgi:hypothetical protein
MCEKTNDRATTFTNGNKGSNNSHLRIELLSSPKANYSQEKKKKWDI